MLVSQLLNTSFPSLNIADKVIFALQLMDDYDLLHLPLVSEDKLLGVVAKEDLLDMDEASQLSAELIKPFYIKQEEHFLGAIRLIANNELSLLPVVNAQMELTGVLLTKELLKTISIFVGNEDRGAVIVLETDKRNFSFGELSRLVETNDSYITQLNTYTEAGTGLVIITLKINRIEVSDIVATFQRYDYTVRYYFGEEEYANELKENYQHLLSYLNI
ncbi:MAG: CBS domain-containing protein [Sphingobacteriia bacterium]|jgi:acetoin utilization protein AcuB|nr:MAG: CBS domain-containing protein [Sphingobacteriia bacterium]